MSEEVDEIIEEKKEDIPVLEVKVVNPPEEKKEKPSDFDSVDDNEYENMYPDEAMIKEYEEE